MSIYQRYELLEIVHDGQVKTFAARQIQTGQIVAVHLLIDPSLDSQELLKKVRALTDPARKELLEFGDHDGTIYVVTTEWKRMVTFPDWVNSVATTAPAGDRFAKAGNWRIPVSEFGRKVEPAAGSPAPPEPKVPPQPAEPHPPTPEPPAPTGPGEFTRMFEAAKRAESPQTNEIGEFTRMFQAQQSSTHSADAQSPPPATPAPSKSEPGEFTRMFQAPASAPQSAIGSSPLPTAHESKQEPGEFTRMFQAPAPPQPKEDIGVSTAYFSGSRDEAGTATTPAANSSATANEKRTWRVHTNVSDAVGPRSRAGGSASAKIRPRRIYSDVPSPG